MTNGSDRLSYLGILRSEGVEMYLAPDGTLRSKGRVENPEIATFIRENRLAVIRELREVTHG